MNRTKDRMGGFIAAEIIQTKDIEFFTVTNGRVNFKVKLFGLAANLDIVKNGVEASASCVTSKSGKIYNIDITIETKKSFDATFTSFNKYLVVLTLPTGEHHVFGTPEFPLTISTEPIYSKIPSGRVGTLYRAMGKQPHNVLIMQ